MIQQFHSWAYIWRKQNQYLEDKLPLPYPLQPYSLMSKIRERCKCLSMDEWMKKMWSVHTMKYYSAERKEKIPSLATTQMKLEGVTSEINEDKRCITWKHSRTDDDEEVMLRACGTAQHWSEVSMGSQVTQLLFSCFATPWMAARQAYLSITISWSLPKFLSIESVML